MKKNKIMFLVFSLILMLTFTACTTKNPNVSPNTNDRLSTRIRDNRWDVDGNGGLPNKNNITNQNNDIFNDVGENNPINQRDDLGINDTTNNDTNLRTDNSIGINDNLRTNDPLNTDNNAGLNNGANNGSNPNLNANNNVRNNTGNIRSMHKNASSIAKKITDLKEVNKANVLISENQAIVGVNLRGSTQSTMTNNLRQKIETIVKNADKSINKVSITTEPNLVNRINTMTTNIGNGNMMDTFAEDMKDLIRKITPNSMK